VQHGLGSPPHADRHSAETEKCEACAVARSGAACGVVPWLNGATVTVEAAVILISWPRIAGRLIVPRHHIGGLEELPLARRAEVLAAIRRASGVVGLEEPPSAQARVIVSTDSPASASHVCFRVLPPDATAP
jgi:hypothetical protein